MSQSMRAGSEHPEVRWAGQVLVLRHGQCAQSTYTRMKVMTRRHTLVRLLDQLGNVCPYCRRTRTLGHVLFGWSLLAPAL